MQAKGASAAEPHKPHRRARRRYQPITLQQISSIDLLEESRNRLAAGDYVRAYLIADWLLSNRPDCCSYRDQLERSREQVLKVNSGLSGVAGMFTSSKHTRQSLDVRLLSMLISVVGSKCKNKLSDLIAAIPNPRLRIALQINWHARWGDRQSWEAGMNDYLAMYGLADYRLRIGSRPLNPWSHQHILQRAHFTHDHPQDAEAGNGRRTKPIQQDGPLVSIVMSAHNSAATIGYAIRSILKQDYPDFELIVVDDASTDHTKQLISNLAKTDSRIRLITQAVNSGPYVCRNIAIKRARGRLITTHDADDFCHPSRLGLQVDWMARHAESMAVIGHWLRIKPNGELLYHNKRGGDFLHGGLATMMYRHEAVHRIGYYDRVRYSGDTEYLFRMRAVYGRDAVAVLRKPIVLAASQDTSLTASRSTFTDSFLGDCPSRRDYRQAWELWHQQCTDHLYIPEHPDQRPFPAPGAMLA
ncbi:MAG: glycosyltransferase [Cyanobacteria bacterium J06638_7]